MPRSINLLLALLLSLAACGKNDYDLAKELYLSSSDNTPPSANELAEPLSQAILLLENFLSRNHEDPRGTLLLWRCYLRAGNPRYRAMHETMIRISSKVRRVIPNEVKDDIDEDMRTRMVELLGEMATPGELKPLIKILNQDQSVKVQQAAAKVLAQMRDANAVPALLPKISSPDPAVRAYACEALAAFPQPQSITALLQCLTDTREVSDVRAAAASSLAEIVSQQSVEAEDVASKLEALLSDQHVSLSTRLLVGMILAETGKNSAYGLALTQANSHDPFIRGLAISILGHVGDSQTVALVAAAYEHASWKLRLQAVEALGNLGDTRGLPTLYKAMSDPIEIVRQLAQISIDKIRAASPAR